MINTSQCFHICAFAKNTQLKTFLEIGTWNGMGSTKTFLNAFNDRFNDNSYSFYSLECNKEKCENAAKLYIDNPNYTTHL
jgi:predicted O-methyltransferase YrrM